jgi:hypothetical protein
LVELVEKFRRNSSDVHRRMLKVTPLMCIGGVEGNSSDVQKGVLINFVEKPKDLFERIFKCFLF